MFWILQFKFLQKSLKAFYLFEFLIYILISSFLAYILTSFISNSYRSRIDFNNNLQESLNISIAFDYFLQDCFNANNINYDNNNIIIKLDSYDCMWVLHDNKLMRISGIYLGNNFWKDKFANLIIKDISFFSLKFSKFKFGYNILFFLKSKIGNEFSCPVNIRIGV